METLNMLFGNRNNLYFSCSNAWGFDHFLYVSPLNIFFLSILWLSDILQKNWCRLPAIGCNAKNCTSIASKFFEHGVIIGIMGSLP